MCDNSTDGIFKDKWDESYKRGENLIFYPKEEVVKFLNRFIRKRLGPDRFIDIAGGMRRALDFGCGIGRQTILLREFGFDSYGVDISEIAIEKAKNLARYFGYNDLVDHFLVFDGLHIPFDDNFFDFAIADSVLDSMRFDLARIAILEIDRVVKRYLYLNLISEEIVEGKEYRSGQIIRKGHEDGTVQSYFDLEKIKKLIEKSSFTVKQIRLITERGIDHPYMYSRFHIVLEK